MRRLSWVVAAFTSVSATLAVAEPSVPEPPGLWPGPMHGTTPATVKGATVLDANRMVEVVTKEKPVLIDVANADHKPSTMPADMPWIPVHRSIPGSTWMPGAGSGTSDPKFSTAFETRVASLTGGDKDKPIVTFCHPQRWGSWNAAKRLADLGYRHVYWFPRGAEGWADIREPTAVSEDIAWKAAGFDTSTVEPATVRQSGGP